MPTGTPIPSVPAGGPPPGGLDCLAAMSAVLARNWWLIALRGAFAILFGIVALVSPGATLLTLVIVFSAYMLVDGVAGIVAAVRAAERHERWGTLLLSGLLNLLVGVVAFLVPGSALLAFVYLLAAWALVTGGLMLAAAFRLHLDHGRWWLGLGGALSILFGLALVVSPAASLIVLTTWMGGYAIAFGAFMLILALRLRSRRAGSAGRAA
ncbi:HdeD family acid-resistance protein [Methylobacterium oryzihabitans]|uniref:HdeD family acid-resistance protein n=1 Tax=Methylobacterium oryzihabitans TaxID=2499852 RepID=A0A437NWD3_9HYPH|nr:HdeD family acid-resistance protein [Methylobacterium oryzihabitans]RVU14329.1 HdeD family acid-resistance protein [Methylobacterium oryzihabitans]